MTSATELASGVPLGGAVAYDDDRDDYVIEASGEQLLEVELRAPDVSYGGSVRVFDELERSICSSLFDQSPPLNLSGVCYLPEAGRYFIRMESHLGRSDHEAGYTLTATLRPVPDEAQEPDNTKDTANVLNSGVPFESYLSYLNDEDHYRIDASGEQLLEVDVTGAEVSYGGYLQVYDELGESIHSTLTDISPPLGLSAVYYLPSEGRYFIKVSGYLGGYDNESPYTLSATLHTAPDQEQEPNNAQEDATPLSSGASLETYISYTGDVDYYSIEATGAQQLQVEVTSDELSFGGYDYFYNALGASICSTGVVIFAPWLINKACDLPEAGTYFVKVASYLSRSSFLEAYTITATLQSP